MFQVEFDFDRIDIFHPTTPALTIQFPNHVVPSYEQIGAKTGLGSQNNVENAEKGKAAFFNWISADGDIATARGGGGGLALWKRVDLSQD